MRTLRGLLLLSLPLLLPGCGVGPEGVVLRDDFLEVRLGVTGGIAGADYSILLDGPTGHLLGESCVSLCQFKSGDTLQDLTRDQVAYLADLFRDAGVRALEDEDFGTECCDQFHYVVEYRDGAGEHRFRGSSEAIPKGLRNAIATLQGIASGLLPVVVDPSTSPEDWSRDPFQLGTAVIQGDFLEIRVTYGGGCRVHDLQAVVWGGWMESYPVQVRAFLSHEDFDDPCDAMVTRDLRFDLGPLKRAYAASYTLGEPGTNRVVILLEDPMLASPLGARFLTYTF